MKARLKLFGHPIHQTLIVLPLGILMATVLFDLVHHATGSEGWAAISYWLIPVGVLNGLAAAIFGLADWTREGWPSQSP